MIRIPPGEVARAGLVLIALGLGAFVLWLLRDLIFLLFLAVLLATAIDPLVKRLRHGPFTTGSGVLAVYTTIIVSIALPVWVFLPSLVAQANAFTEALPDRIESLRPYVEQLEPRPLQQAAVSGIDRLAVELRQPGAPPEEELVQTGATVAHTIINFLMVFVLAFYWLTERSVIQRALIRLVPPRSAADVAVVWLEVEDKLGGWVRGQLLLMLFVGVMAGLAFWAIGLPNPALLAVTAAFAEMIPILGPFLAFAPALLVALAVDPGKILLVLLAAVVIQQVEGLFLVPRVMSRTVGISPLTVLTGILAGATVYGMAGALLAVPVAGAIQVILGHSLSLHDLPDEDPDVELRPAEEEQPSRT